MKRIFFGLIAIPLFMSSSCSTSAQLLTRMPASVPTIKDGTQMTSSAAKPVEKYLKYFLVRNNGFGSMDQQDCKAFAQRSPTFCKTDDCKALFNEQDHSCKEANCRAFVLNRPELCSDEVCVALINSQPEKCKPDDKLCLSVVNNETSTCNSNADCRAWIDNSNAACHSNQCKAIVGENINFCDTQPAQ